MTLSQSKISSHKLAWLSSRTARVLATILCLLAVTAPKDAVQARGNTSSSPYIYGTLGSEAGRTASDYAAGIRLELLEVGWDRYEPQEGKFDTVYTADLKRKAAALRFAGMQVDLDFGLQYPPGWVFKIPNSHYIDQFGDLFTDRLPGMNGVNAIFNGRVREKQAAYVRQVLKDLGTDFYAVRLGWGWYGELNFPPNSFADHKNCYWAFDAIAQGKARGLPTGVVPCPVPGWAAGDPTADHRSARLFAEWYMDSLKNYHDWQIRTVRKYYRGRLAMLYPSWGIRPGQLEKAIAVDLNGSTYPEINGEVQRGFDFGRFIPGIRDRNVVVYCTWLDAANGDDGSSDPAQWRPVHWLSWLAQRNPRHLRVWGENTGNNDAPAMQRCFEQMTTYHLIGMNWAFQPQLYGEQYASIRDYARLITGEQGRK